jgi:hypothetical protein
MTRSARQLLGTMLRHQMQASVNIRRMDEPLLERLGSTAILHISYERDGINGDTPWQVHQYKIPRTNDLVELTGSYRERERALYEPMILASIGSIRVSGL